MKEAALASLAADARAIRQQLVRMHYRAGSGHLGTGLSAIDLLTYIHARAQEPQDAFILSKGHGASALYATLHHFGLLDAATLSSYYRDGTLLPAHPAPHAHPRIPLATGSLGHGLPVAAGMALSRLVLAPAPGHIVCMLSDGECNEGTTWEAAMFAAHHRLTNLIVVIDANGLQGFGRTREVIDLEPFAAKWRAFGFAVREIDGHDFRAMPRAFRADRRRPTCVLARTVKGRGISFMEDSLAWHYLPLSAEQARAAMAELGGEIEEAADAR